LVIRVRALGNRSVSRWLGAVATAQQHGWPQHMPRTRARFRTSRCRAARTGAGISSLPSSLSADVRGRCFSSNLRCSGRRLEQITWLCRVRLGAGGWCDVSRRKALGGPRFSTLRAGSGAAPKPRPPRRQTHRPTLNSTLNHITNPQLNPKQPRTLVRYSALMHCSVDGSPLTGVDMPASRPSSKADSDDSWRGVSAGTCAAGRRRGCRARRGRGWGPLAERTRQPSKGSLGAERARSRTSRPRARARERARARAKRVLQIWRAPGRGR
jgi:hypothetical protein